MSKLPDRYIADGSTAKGGFGDVKFCDDKNLSRKVAIKFIQDPLEIDRLKDELSALLQMRSKHVVQVFDLITCDDGSFGIVEEFIDGDDLWKYTKPSSIQNYLKTLWQIASGIADIHQSGLIHRDIKLSNIKLDPENIIKIYDFGLARNVGNDAKTLGFVGTKGFAAPELYSHGHVEFTQAIDTYAFGISAFFLSGATKLPPEQCLVPPANPVSGLFSTLPISIPVELSQILEACLLSSPTARPSMLEVRDILKKLLLKDSHQALAVMNGTSSLINAKNNSVSISFGNIGKFDIVYDGLDFNINSITGDVYLNNAKISTTAHLPGSCVIAIGGSHLKSNQRAFITFDISNPEVMI